MGDPETASEDPIYWSFHAFIDLIWARWQRLYTSAQTPQPFADGTPTLWVEPFTPKISDTATTTGLLYEYDYDFGPADGPIPILIASASKPTRTIGVSVTAEKGLSVSGRPSADLEVASRNLLRIRGIMPRRDTTYELHIFIHPAAIDLAAASDSDRDKYLVETATIWKGAHHAAAFDAYVDISNAIRELGATSWMVTIQANAVPIASGTAEERAKREALHAAIGSTRSLFGALEIEER
jgi:tyrosinase